MATQPARPGQGIRPYRLLVVEDEKAIRDGLRRALEADGYEVETAPDGVAAMAKYVETKPDLVLTDLSMPRMNGLDLVQRLRNENPDVPVIVLTAHGTLEDALTAFRHGARDFLFKPISREEVLHAVRRALGIRTLTREESEVRGRTTRRLALTIPSREDLVGGVVFEVVYLAKGFYTSSNDLEVRIPLLVSESCYNAVEHGNRRDPEKVVRVEAEVSPKGMTISVEDEGDGFEPPPQDDDEVSLSARGRGLLLMRLYADELRHEAGGRRVVLRLDPPR